MFVCRAFFTEEIEFRFSIEREKKNYNGIVFFVAGKYFPNVAFHFCHIVNRIIGCCVNTPENRKIQWFDAYKTYIIFRFLFPKLASNQMVNIWHWSSTSTAAVTAERRSTDSTPSSLKYQFSFDYLHEGPTWRKKYGVEGAKETIISTLKYAEART